jgi:hypothetical protein
MRLVLVMDMVRYTVRSMTRFSGGGYLLDGVATITGFWAASRQITYRRLIIALALPHDHYRILCCITADRVSPPDHRSRSSR